MGSWKFGASAKEFERFEEYARQFDLLEVDLEKAEKLGFDLPAVVEMIRPFENRLYSIHLRYGPDKEAGLDGIDVSLRDLEFFCQSGLTDELRISTFVTHTDSPREYREFEHHLARLGAAAAQYGVTVAVENLSDRKNKTNGYMDPRNPRKLAEVLDVLRNPHLGLCLDTGHAIGNAGLTDSLQWDTDAMRRWIRHVHYNDNVIREDKHLPLGEATNPLLIGNVKYLLENSVHDGVAIFEHKKLDFALQSMAYAQTAGYRGIAAAPIK